MISRRLFLGAGGAALLPPRAKAVPSRGAAPPQLFFYPAPVQMPDGTIMFSPVAMTTQQVTTQFPQIAEMAGIVLSVYWSRLVRGNELDLSMIEQTLDFWRTAGKQVVLGVATFGHPLMVTDAGVSRFVTPTPSAVLAKVQTFMQDAPPIAPVRPRKSWAKMPTVLPVYWDPEFLGQVGGLVRQLARYDGHAGLSKVRISTGILGEDNPSFDGLRSNMPGFGAAAWLTYCRTMTDLYLKWFKRTQLEFDLGMVGWIYTRGGDADRKAADDFIGYLTRNRVFLAMNGFDTVTIASWRVGQANRSGEARCVEYLGQAHAAGAAIGVEGAPLFNPRLADTQAIGRAARDLGASRFVLFGDVPGSLNYVRRGRNPQNEALLGVFPAAEVEHLASQARALMNAVGYPG